MKTNSKNHYKGETINKYIPSDVFNELELRINGEIDRDLTVLQVKNILYIDEGKDYASFGESSYD